MGAINVMGLTIYTDGGCAGNPGPGAWAYIILKTPGPKTDPGQRQNLENSNILTEKWGAEKDTTNNRMELSAVIAALETVFHLNLSEELITIYTDSQYVQKGISAWIHTWKHNGWLTSERKPVKNKELWQRLDELAANLALNWKWIKGHAGNQFNERCDRMTQEAIRSLA
jgi:ribonuclease HI